MARILYTVFILLFSLHLQAQTEDSLVLESFAQYRNALLTDQGELAARCVDSRTMKYYTDILQKTLHADSLKVDAMGLIDKITVLSLRHRASKSDLLKFNGHDVFVYAVDNGMVGKDGVANASLGEVSVIDDFAKAEFIVNGQKTPFFFHFYKEGGVWKMDITNLFSLGQMALKQVINDSGQSENDFILYILEFLTGEVPSQEVWKPIAE